MNGTTTVKALFCAALVLIAGTANAAEKADNYPVRPIRFLVGFAAGGANDLVARLVATKLGPRLGQQVIVDNRAGGGGILAHELLVNAAPDGYTMILASVTGLAMAPALRGKVPYDPIRDFVPVAPGGSSPNMLVAHPSVPVRTVADVIRLAKSRPDQVSFGSSGIGTLPHLAAEMFNGMAGLKMTHIPYKGSPQATFDLIAGQFELMFGIGSAVMPEVKNGRLRALAATTLVRLPALPELPTVSESGLRGFEAVTWFGFVAPAGTPRDIVLKLNAEITRVAALPEVRQQLAAQSIDALNGTPEQFSAYIRDEIAKWAKVVKTSGARAE
jgi:tripartite-type tricarboxylate transporter receptor subunit TctC